MTWLALDIGGANLKIADGLGYAASVSFPLWQSPATLAQELRNLMARAPAARALAVTMTGELADCYPTKREGVLSILAAAAEAADGRELRVYLNDGSLVSTQVAAQRPLEAAASNWHALATLAAQLTEGRPALLIDVGSTTCDVVPIVDGRPTPRGLTDTQRLLAGELVYAGVERTPICSLVRELPYRGQPCGIARELFATTQDVFVLLDDLPEDPDNKNTADGRPATKAGASRRIARMLCADHQEVDHADATVAAGAVKAAAVGLLKSAVHQVLAYHNLTPSLCILSGQGDFLAQQALDELEVSASQLPLRQHLGTDAARCAPAHALAVLARQVCKP